MPRQYKPLPPLEELSQRLRLTDEHPSGLEWAETTTRHVEGEMAGYLEHYKRYYVVAMAGQKFHAHRIVYYMRTGIDPGMADVVRPSDKPRDQVPQEMVLEQRKGAKPRTRRNSRKSAWY